MAKDPAILFYTSDFLTGTFTMTNDQVGMYIRLLCIQHQKGLLTEKDMINVCGTYVEEVFSKFTKTEAGFINIRLSEEAERRKKFCESRRKSRQHINNQSKDKKTYVERMETETENTNETINTTEIENFLVPEMQKIYLKHNPKYKKNKERDFRPLLSIAKFLAEQGDLNGTIEENKGKVLAAWDPLCQIISKDKFYSTKTLSTISNQIQEITQIALHGKSNGKPDYGSKERAKEYDRLFAERYGKG